MKKFLLFLKTHWYLPLLFILLVPILLFFNKNSSQKIFELIKKTRTNYKNQLEFIEKNNQKAKKEKEQLQSKLEKNLNDLEVKKTTLLDKQKEEIEKKSLEETSKELKKRFKL